MPQLANLEDVNQFLTRFYSQSRGPYKLVNMRRLMTYLGNQQDSYKVIHIAGTSGKTSTAYYMSALLTASGKKVGMTVSPYVEAVNERVQINGEPLGEEIFAAAITKFAELVKPSGIKPSWFEFIVAFAYWYFAEVKVDYAVVEVGLGGLKDGTNVITRSDKVCVITDIGYDHQEVLGDDLGSIAAQKAGIILSHNAIFTHRQSPEVLKVIKNKAKQCQADIHIIDNKPTDKSTDLAAYQQRNWQLAYAAFSYVQNKDDLSSLTSQVLATTQKTQIPGRMETLSINGKTIVLDGAHNDQKMTTFLESFRERYPEQKPVVLLAMRDDKDFQAVADSLTETADQFIVTNFVSAQDLPIHSLSPATLAKALTKAGAFQVEVVEDPQAALKALLSKSNDLCIITGSFYLISQIRNNKLLND